MTTFYFGTQDSDCALDEGEGCELPDLVSAIDEAKKILSEMAADGIPRKDGQELVVEILDVRRIPVVRLALALTVSFVAFQDDVERLGK